MKMLIVELLAVDCAQFGFADGPPPVHLLCSGKRLSFLEDHSYVDRAAESA